MQKFLPLEIVFLLFALLFRPCIALTQYYSGEIPDEYIIKHMNSWFPDRAIFSKVCKEILDWEDSDCCQLLLEDSLDSNNCYALYFLIKKTYPDFEIPQADKNSLRKQIINAKRKNIWKNHKKFNVIRDKRFIKKQKSIYYIKLSIPIFFNSYQNSLMKLEIYFPGKTKEIWYYLFIKKENGFLYRKKIPRFEQIKH